MQPRDEREQIRRLATEKRELEHAVAPLHVKVLALEALVEEVEAHTGLRIKKMVGAAVPRGRAVMRAQRLPGGLAALCAVCGKS